MHADQIENTEMAEKHLYLDLNLNFINHLDKRFDCRFDVGIVYVFKIYFAFINEGPQLKAESNRVR